MNDLVSKARDHEWLDYYRKFHYFSAEAVREGCYPRIREHGGTVRKAVVLVHGLSDSPYFVAAIADYFFEVLGYNVYLPLLHSHGLKDPKGMEDVSLVEWKANVDFAIDQAAAKAGQVSVGGLSTGGALSLYAAARNPKINGALYLFSAALDLAGGPGGLAGEIAEHLLGTFLADVLDNLQKDQPLIGKNPYRYARVDLDGARELSKLLKDTDAILRELQHKPFAKPVFAAHSESDKTANISAIEDLQKATAPGLFKFFRIPKAAGVAHASIVLKEPVYASDAGEADFPLEYANPLFQHMLKAAASIA